MEKVNIEERVLLAESYFSQGYNCCQSVVMAYADRYSIDPVLMASISSPFGGGMGRLREVCGSVSAAFMISGLEVNSSDPKDSDSQKRSYAAVQQIAKEFSQENGSIVCRELLGLKPMNPDYCGDKLFHKRPCAHYVKSSAQIVGEFINKTNINQ